MLRAMWLTATLLAIVAPLAAEETTAATNDEQARIATWVSELGDSRYAVREAAQAALTRSGMAARDQLQAAEQSRDAEVRHRVRQILTLLNASEFEQQLEAFLADVDGEQNVTLPAWELAKPYVGDDLQGRNLFVQMSRAEPELFRAVQKNPAQAEKMLVARIAAVQTLTRQIAQGRRVEPKLGTYGALLLAGVLTELHKNEMASLALCQLCLQAPFPAAMLDARQRPGLSKMLAAWVEQSAQGSVNLQHQVMMLATTHELPQGLISARRVLASAGAQSGHRVYALLLTARFGTKEEIPLVEPLLKDKSVYAQSRVKDQVRAIQMRDLALGVLVHLSGQKLQDYGFDQAQEHPQYVFSPHTLVFRDDATREAALARWEAWRKTGE